MLLRCDARPSECGYYRGGHCVLFDRACVDMLSDECKLGLGLTVKCYLDASTCKDIREDGFCARHCCDCAAVHEPGIWEDGQDEREEDER